MVRLVKKISFGSFFTGQSRFDDLVATLRTAVDAQALGQRAQAEARYALCKAPAHDVHGGQE